MTAYRDKKHVSLKVFKTLADPFIGKYSFIKVITGVLKSDTALYDAPGDQRLVEHEWCTSKAQINGSLSHITGIFGFSLAGLVIQDIIANCWDK